MKLTAKVKLARDEQQRRMLLATLERANEACNRVSELSEAWQSRGKPEEYVPLKAPCGASLSGASAEGGGKGREDICARDPRGL